MKLSQPQLDTLGQAYIEMFSTNRPGRYRTRRGWFMAQHHECAPVITRWQTCASLCGLGLLEYETMDYVKQRGEWRPINEYRITPTGAQIVQDMRLLEYIKILQATQP